ncbi:tetracycline resistance MFS efflux pump [Actinoplanes italicus]|uniref:DHA1 family tetracycline resistance protein-like MFS transporter n=1 Tax=Actinoplanes italicus TaxID=113567 RepID=A0A2T0K2N5_9ACTN|nr:MFS transporter [Actinoplanes italicus]PRX16833.1 DHA1 family tetracycline resistance protein-like MFS transporter [Actinoplanes italicus]GIE31035.1 tetracycline resistance MFS efflux pump [Actinoplanes italicus]
MKFLLVTVFIDMLGLGLIVPILPALMTAVTTDPAAAVLWSGVLGSTYGLLQFVLSPLLGRVSDRYGRRPVLLVSLTCLGVDWLAHAAASGPWTLLLFHALAGACAGTNTVVNAYVADVTEPAGRARAYGRIGAAFGLGFVAGPTLGGLLGAVDVRLPFLAAAVLCFANAAYGWLILPESRPGDRTTPLTLRTANPVTAITVVLRRPVLGRLTWARLCADVSRMIHQSVWSFFLAVQFAWTTAHIGAVMAAGALAGALFQARAVAPIVRRLGDRRSAIAGNLIGVISLTVTAVATTPWMLYTAQAIGVTASFGGAAAQSWISRNIRVSEQGTVQGALTGVGAIAEACVPVTAGVAFASLIAYGSPALIFVGAALFAAAGTILLATVPEPDRA